MTVWGFVSDIHGSYESLRRAEAECEAHGATRFASLGDVIGRGNSVACVGWVRDNADIAVVGNRDLDYIGRLPDDLQRVVKAWPREAQASNFIVSHGDSRLHRELSSTGEREQFRRAIAYLSKQHADLWFFGHTHRARVWELQDGRCDLMSGEVVEIHSGACYVVNVGTTGLRLPGRGPASCCVYDDSLGKLIPVPLESGAGPKAQSEREMLPSVVAN